MARGLLRVSILALSSASAFINPCVRPAVPAAKNMMWRTTAAAASSSSALSSSRSFSSLKLKATATTDTSMTKDEEKPWKINLLYDGKCSLCMKEVSFLQKRDVESVIKFTDLNAEDFTPEANGGVDWENGMKYIHAVLPDGKVVKGVEVFRRIYEVLGLGWVYSATKLPIIGDLADWAYDKWAMNRLRITNRPDLEVLLKERQEALKAKDFSAGCDDDGECEIDWSKM